jgi:hypothetical protein
MKSTDPTALSLVGAAARVGGKEQSTGGAGPRGHRVVESTGGAGESTNLAS